MLYGDCPISQFRERLSCTGSRFCAGPMHFHCVRNVLRCRGHRGRRRGISVGKPHQLSGLVLPVTLDWTRQMLELLPRSIGWDGSVISSWTHWPSSCQSGVQHHQRRHWSTIFYCSCRVFRGICYLWFGQVRGLPGGPHGGAEGPAQDGLRRSHMLEVGHQPGKGSTGCLAWDGGLQSGALTPNWTRGPSFHTGAIW